MTNTLILNNFCHTKAVINHCQQRLEMNEHRVQTFANPVIFPTTKAPKQYMLTFQGQILFL